MNHDQINLILFSSTTHPVSEHSPVFIEYYPKTKIYTYSRLPSPIDFEEWLGWPTPLFVVWDEHQAGLSSVDCGENGKKDVYPLKAGGGSFLKPNTPLWNAFYSKKNYSIPFFKTTMMEALYLHLVTIKSGRVKFHTTEQL